MSQQFDPNTIGGGLVRRTLTILFTGYFYPTQAMLDAGGVLDLDIRGGGGGYGADSNGGGSGGDSCLITSMTLTSLTPIPVTIGAGGAGNNSASGTAGGHTYFGSLVSIGGGGGVAGTGGGYAGGGYGGGNMGRSGQHTFNAVNSAFSGAVSIKGISNGSDYGMGGGYDRINGINGAVRVSWWEKV